MIDQITEALAAHDFAVAKCPVRNSHTRTKIKADDDCPVCGASSNEACRIAVRASAALVERVRVALATKTEA